MFFYKDNKYTSDSIILLRDHKSIINRAFLIISSEVYLYITKTDNKYREYLISIIYLRRIFSLNVLLIIYFTLKAF